MWQCTDWISQACVTPVIPLQIFGDAWAKYVATHIKQSQLAYGLARLDSAEPASSYS